MDEIPVPSRGLMLGQVEIWSQVRTRQEIDLENNSESWTTQDDKERSVMQIVLRLDRDSVHKAHSCSLLPHIIDSK